MTSMNERQALRRQLRAQRAQLEPAWCAQTSRTVCEHLTRSWTYRRARCIAMYLSSGNEVNLDHLIEHAWASGKQVYLPVLGLRFTGQLWFVPYTSDSPLYANRFGIPEPQHNAHERRTGLRELDLVLMPLVGFDEHGNRLGMGGGFYDKSLHNLHSGKRVWSRPKRIGIAYEMQRVAQIPSEEWDVPLDGVATEQGLVWF